MLLRLERNVKGESYGHLGRMCDAKGSRTEAGGMGAFAAILLSLAYRRLTWRVLSSSAVDTISSVD